MSASASPAREEAFESRLILEDFLIPDGSAWAGRPLSALLDGAANTMVLAIKRAGVMQLRPPGDTQLAAGDEVVAAGSPAEIRTVQGRL